ncbi:NET1-associated nuclear protein 1, partial [Coemansia spiralis]
YSSDGMWMATVDSRRADAARGLMAVTESYLKFWQLDPSDQMYKLASRIDNPHTGGVHAIAFQPVLRKGALQPDAAGLLCASTGRDGSFRVWELQTSAPAPGGNSNNVSHSFWTCRATVQYRGLQPHGAAFSADGSTLAVTFGGAVTLWDAQTCAAPVAALVSSAAAPRLAGVAFIGSTPYLAAWSAERLDVWNMLTGSVWWTLAMPIRDVFAHQRAALLAVVAYQIPGSSTASIMVYSPTSPTPLAAVQHPGGVDAVALVPAPASAKSGRSHPDTEDGQPKPDPLDDNTLVVLTPTGLISVYGAESETSVFAARAPRPAADAAARQLSSAAFSAIFGPQPAAAVPQPAEPAAVAGSRVQSAMRLVRSAVQASYVSAPHHVLPPVASLYDQFVTAQLLPAPAAVSDAQAERADADGDTDMVDALPAAPAPAVDLWSEPSTAFFAAMRKGYSAAS